MNKLTVGHDEGWGVFEIDGDNTRRAIQKLDTSEVFATDAQAIAHVKARMHEGSELHRLAWAWVAVSPEPRRPIAVAHSADLQRQAEATQDQGEESHDEALEHGVNR
jgi:hypothetical protein